ncbi:MAG: SURF1 family protein [Rhodobacteraceae bacterium]|nr:SURF1 family protein [Paracoccaceae bacterium]
MSETAPASRAILAPLLIGLVGGSVLVSLGLWQVQRLTWKEGLIAGIEARIHDAPIPLPDAPTQERDQYLPVIVEGAGGSEELRILVSRRDTGPGYRIVTTFETGGGRVILLDRGFVPDRARNAPRTPAEGRIVGNLLWPNEVDGAFTPAPDIEANVWFARDLPAMAARLGTEPLLVVQREGGAGGPGAPRPWPVDTAHIPNDHLEYAGTWFSLALFWFGMTGYWLWRIRRRRT